MVGAFASVALAILGFLLGATIGVLTPWAKISGGLTLRCRLWLYVGATALTLEEVCQVGHDLCGRQCEA